MKQAGGTKHPKLKVKKVPLKAKHAKPFKATHVLALIVFVLIGLGIILAAFSYIYNQYHQQQVENTISRDQLDYGAITPNPIDSITLAVLSGGIVIAILGTTLTLILIVKHNNKHHIYRVASGRSVPVPHHRAGAPKGGFAVGQTEESRQQAQSSVEQTDKSSQEQTVSTRRHIAIQ